MINFILSIMAHKGLITEKEAKELSTRLAVKTHPAKFPDAHKVVEQVFKEISRYK